MRRPAGGPAREDRSEGLAILGVQAGEAVRWRTTAGSRWQHGSVARRERDGSVGVTDRDGASRSIAVERIEVGSRGRRGGRAWEALTVRAARCEQLTLDLGQGVAGVSVERGR